MRGVHSALFAGHGGNSGSSAMHLLGRGLRLGPRKSIPHYGGPAVHGVMLYKAYMGCHQEMTRLGPM